MSIIRNLTGTKSTYSILGIPCHGVRWRWTFADSEEYDGEPRYIWHTNDAGEGIFVYDRKRGDDKQIRGTCDFCACQTVSGMRRKLNREFSND